MDNKKFYALDAIRGIAAIFVVLRHSGEFFNGNYFFNSFLAVDIFFLLSGFVIAHAYEKKLKTGALSISEFIKVRFIRLYPLFVFSILISSALLITKSALTNSSHTAIETIPNIFLTLLFIPNFFQDINISAPLFILNVVFWSLFFELAANIFYALFRARLNTPTTIALILINAFVIFYFAYKDGSIDNGFSWGLGSIALGTARAFFGIFFGMYIYKIYRQSLMPQWLSSHLLLPIALASLMLACPNLYNYNWILQLIAIYIVFPLCVLWAANADRKTSLSKTFTLLGAISYPLYVLHIPATQYLNLFLKEDIRHFAPWSGIIFLLVLCIACFYIERYIESPARRQLKRLLIKTKLSD
jgi:peptidoglycan/LPS O-acetylase OafA/YrhL